MAMAFLQRLSAREKTLFGVCGIAVFMWLVSALVAKPIRDRFRGLGLDIETVSHRLNNNYRTIAKKRMVFTEFDRIKEHIARAQDGQDQGPLMLTEIEQLARGCNVNMLGRQIQESAMVDQYFEQYTAKVDVQGDIEQIVNLLYKLDTSSQLLRVKKIDLNPDADRPNILKATLLITKMISL